MSLVRSTRAELKALGVSTATDGLAALTMLLAGQLDANDEPKATASLARQHQAALVEIRTAVARRGPAQEDPVDEIRKQRERRRGAS